MFALLLSCQGDTGGPSIDTGSSGEAGGCVDTWDTWAGGLLRTWCASCHSSELPEGMRYGAPVGVDFDTYSATARHVGPLERVVTGDDPSMPPVGGPSASERARLAAWIACGAPESGNNAR